LREIVQVRDKWSDLVIVEKKLGELWRPEEEEITTDSVREIIINRGLKAKNSKYTVAKCSLAVTTIILFFKSLWFCKETLKKRL